LCADNGVNVETPKGVQMKSVIWYEKTKEGYFIPDEVPLYVSILDPKKSIIRMLILSIRILLRLILKVTKLL